MMSLFALQGAVELGLGYGLMALGLYISYRIVNVADLTVDGSFTLGAATAAVCTVSGHAILGMVLGTIMGAIAGFMTALLQTKLRIQPILAGILVMTGLYSVNLRIMRNKPNISLLGCETIFTNVAAILGKDISKIWVILGIVIIVLGFVILFFKTQLGLTIRATGDNEAMVRSSSINADRTKTIGLCLANAIVALSGTVISQIQMFADSNMGIGMVVIGLASIIIGEVLFGRSCVTRGAISAICGSVVYRVIIAFVLELGLPQSDLKLISSIIVALAISYPVFVTHIARNKAKKGGKKRA